MGSKSFVRRSPTLTTFYGRKELLTSKTGSFLTSQQNAIEMASNWQSAHGPKFNADLVNIVAL